MASQEVDYKTSKPKKILYMGLLFLFQGDNKKQLVHLNRLCNEWCIKAKEKAGDGSFSISCLNSETMGMRKDDC